MKMDRLVMRKFILLSLLLVYVSSSTVQALSWLYPFVVWEGNTYKVEDETIPENKVGKVIGEVKSKPDGMTGAYEGDASNYYPLGTKYHKIKGISTSVAIAVQEENQWIKAVNVDPSSSRSAADLSSNTYYYLVAVVIVASLIVVIALRIKRTRNKR